MRAVVGRYYRYCTGQSVRTLSRGGALRAIVLAGRPTDPDAQRRDADRPALAVRPTLIPLTKKYHGVAAREIRDDQSPHDESAQRTSAIAKFFFLQAAATAEPKLAQHSLRGASRGEPKSPSSPLTSSGGAARHAATNRGKSNPRITRSAERRTAAHSSAQQRTAATYVTDNTYVGEFHDILAQQQEYLQNRFCRYSCSQASLYLQ